MSNYLVHSQGPWKDHKYIKKEGDKYIYSDSESLSVNKNLFEVLKKTGNKNKAKISLKGSGKGSEKTSTKSSKSSGSSKEKKVNSEKTSKSTKEKMIKETTKKLETPNVGIRKSLSNVIKIGENDSIFSHVTDDNKWNVRVEFEDGNIQEFILGTDYSIIKKGEKKKKDLEHSGLYLVHSAKGTTWKEHKYIRKEGDKYIYKVPSEIPTSESNTDTIPVSQSMSEDYQIQLKPGEYNNPDDINKYYDYWNSQLEKERKWFEDYAQGTDGYDDSIKKINDDIAWNEMRRKAYLKEAEDYEKKHPEIAKERLKKTPTKAYATREFSHSDYLVHHGRLGQKWGVLNGPPYPLDYGKLSPDEKQIVNKRINDYSNKGYSIKKIARKVNLSELKVEALMNRQKTNAEKANKKRLEEEAAKRKEDIINTGNIAEANKYRDSLTNEEINKVIARYDLNKKLSDIDASTVKKGESKYEKFTKSLVRYTTIAEKGSRAYDITAKVINAFTGSSLPIVNGNNNNNNKNNNNNNKNNNPYNAEKAKWEAEQAKIKYKVDKENYKALKAKHKAKEDQQNQQSNNNQQQNNQNKGNVPHSGRFEWGSGEKKKKK